MERVPFESWEEEESGAKEEGQGHEEMLVVRVKAVVGEISG